MSWPSVQSTRLCVYVCLCLCARARARIIAFVRLDVLFHLNLIFCAYFSSSKSFHRVHVHFVSSLFLCDVSRGADVSVYDALFIHHLVLTSHRKEKCCSFVVDLITLLSTPHRQHTHTHTPIWVVRFGFDIIFFFRFSVVVVVVVALIRFSWSFVGSAPSLIWRRYVATAMRSNERTWERTANWREMDGRKKRNWNETFWSSADMMIYLV